MIGVVALGGRRSGEGAWAWTVVTTLRFVMAATARMRTEASITATCASTLCKVAVAEAGRIGPEYIDDRCWGASSGVVGPQPTGSRPCQGGYDGVFDAQFKVVFDAIRELMSSRVPPGRKIGFGEDGS